MNKYQDYARRNRILARRAQAGDIAARDEMVAFNMGLVYKQAFFYSRVLKGGGLDQSDLVQEGVFGLMTAIERYDVTRKETFSTYAFPWIRQSISRALMNGDRSIRIPIHVLTIRNQMVRDWGEIVAKYGDNPTNEEIAEFLKAKVGQVEAARDIQAISSLDSTLQSQFDGAEGTTLGELIADPNVDVEHAAIDEVQYQALREIVAGELHKLSENEQIIIKRRFGWNGTHPQSLDAVGEELGFTKQWVRQLEQSAISKLRNSESMQKLAGRKPHYKVRNKNGKVVGELDGFRPLEDQESKWL